jgi:hypothetical protein
MWDKMSKLKYLTWKDGCKSISLKASSEVVSLKATNSVCSVAPRCEVVKRTGPAGYCGNT